MQKLLNEQVDATNEACSNPIFTQSIEGIARAAVIYLSGRMEGFAIARWRVLPSGQRSSVASQEVSDVPDNETRVSLPNFVKTYDDCFISCTDLDPKRPVGDVMTELLIRTSGRCVYGASALPIDSVLTPSTVGIRHEYQDLTPRNWVLPTIFVIEFPHFQHRPDSETLFTVYTQISGQDWRMSNSFLIGPSRTFQDLQGVKVIAEDYDEILPFGSPVARVIESLIEGDDLLSKMASSPLPWLLSDGIRVVMLHGLSNKNKTTSRMESTSDSRQEPPAEPMVAFQPPKSSSPFLRQLSAIGSHGAAETPMSDFSSPATFMTASTPASFMTARSTYASPAFGELTGMSPGSHYPIIHENEPMHVELSAPLKQLRDEYHAALLQHEILQPFDKELNWSGKGQHVAFLPKESVPLEMLANLGSSITAKVDKVRCRRIALAKKSMRCTRQWTIADALREVYHLQNLRHFHIVQLVGSYLQGRNFSILMYPVADCHLGTFLEDTADSGGFAHKMFLSRSLACLASAVGYVHEHTTKHMDIKPQNILVREINSPEWRIYLADFGLSRSFSSESHSQTDGPTSRTPRYCAPEVFQYESRGRSADIFSLGCVFCEILTVCAGFHPQEFADFRRGDGNDESFHSNLPRVLDWMEERVNGGMITNISYSYKLPHNLFKSSIKMISYDPQQRPLAHDVIAGVGKSWSFPGIPDCCTLPPEPYVAYEEQKSNAMSAPEDSTGNG